MREPTASEPVSADGERSPVDQALDVFVYAPLGLALEARTLLPKLATRGRQQVTMAKMVGQFAVKPVGQPYQELKIIRAFHDNQQSKRSAVRR